MAKEREEEHDNTPRVIIGGAKLVNETGKMGFAEAKQGGPDLRLTG